jgi:hypothetical protein
MGRCRVQDVVVPTCGRPNALRRCIEGILKCSEMFDRKLDITVADSSEEERDRTCIKDILCALSRQYHTRIMYIGEEERRTFVEMACVGGADPEIIDFATSGRVSKQLSRAGANRNVLLLATAGKSFISLDDDMEASFVELRDGFSFGGDTVWHGMESPVQQWIYPDRETLIESINPRQVDFIRCHEELLGIECDAYGRVDGSHRWTNPSSVVVTIGGAFGDCGWGSPSRYLSFNGASLQRLMQSNGGYAENIVSREVLQVSPEYYVANRVDDMMSGFFGARGETTLPPFLPIGRGQDILFAQLIRSASDNALFGYLPIAAMHNPGAGRQFWPGEICRDAASVDLSTSMCNILRYVSNFEVRGDDGIQRLGKRIGEVGAMSQKALCDLLEDGRRDRVYKIAEKLNARMDESDMPLDSSYVKDVRHYIGRAVEGNQEGYRIVPSELLYEFERDEALVVFQKIVRMFGGLLEQWQEIAKYAPSMRDFAWECR